MKVYNDFGHVSIVADVGNCVLQISHMPSNIVRFTVTYGGLDVCLQIGDVVLGVDDWWYVNDRMYGGM